MDWEKLLAGLGAFIVAVGGGVTGWWVLIRGQQSKSQAEAAKLAADAAKLAADAAKQKADDENAVEDRKSQKSARLRTEELQYRKDLTAEQGVVIQRFEEINARRDLEIAAIRRDAEAQIQLCESRERESNARIARLENQIGRAVERILLLQALMEKTKGRILPAFKIDDDGSALHAPLK